MSQILLSGQPWMEVLVVAEPGTVPGSSTITSGPTITMPYLDQNGAYGADDSSNWSLSATNPSGDGITFVVQGQVPDSRDGWTLCPIGSVTFSDGNTYLARLERIQVGKQAVKVASGDDPMNVPQVMVKGISTLAEVVLFYVDIGNGAMAWSTQTNGQPPCVVYTGSSWTLADGAGGSWVSNAVDSDILPFWGAVTWTQYGGPTASPTVVPVQIAVDASGNAPATATAQALQATSAQAAAIATSLSTVTSSLAGMTTPPSATAIANAVLSQGVAAVEGVADPHSLAYVVLAMSEWTIAATNVNQLTIFRSDGVTPFATKTLTRQLGAKPIVGVK